MHYNISVPETPPANSASFTSRALDFLKRLGLILGASLAAVGVISLALGQFNAFGVSSFLFWAALVLLAVGAWPVIAELGSSVSLAKQVIVDKKELPGLIEAEQARREKWIATSVLYGTAGILNFVLSLVAATLFAAR